MKNSSNDKYKKIDPWELIGETLIAAPTYIVEKTLKTAFSLGMEKVFPHGVWGRHYKAKKFVKDSYKLKILSCLIKIPEKFDLTEKELKIACHIVGSPWISNNIIQTENELKFKIIHTNIEQYKKIILKYIEPLSDQDIYYLRFSFEAVEEPHNISLKEFLKGEYRESWVNTLLEILEIEYERFRDFPEVRPVSKNQYEVEKVYSNLALYLSSVYSSIISTDDLSKEFDDLTKNLFEDKDNIYKAAVDANYASDKSLYGGPYHRLFDDSHSLGKMWGKIKDAKPDDSKIEEIIAWVNEAAKDLQTTMGLPIVSMEKETFDKMAEFLGPIGINKNDLYDLLTYNLQEVLSVAFLGITTMLPSIKKDKKKLNTLRGVMAASGVFGNPLALIFLLITLVHSMVKGNTEQFKKDLTSKEAIIGFSISAIIKYSIDFLGAKAIITVLAILMALLIVVYFFRHVKNKKISYKKFKREFVAELENLREMSKNLLDKENIKPLPKK